MKAFFQSSLWNKLKWPLAALGLVLLYNFFFTPGFFNVEMKNGRFYGSLIDVLNRAAPVMLISLGMTLVIATGGVDLSVGAVMAIVGSVAVLLMQKAGIPTAVVISAALGIAIVTGLLNGALIGYFGISPIVATLILMVAGRGIAQLLTGGYIIRFNNEAYEFIGRGAVLGMPFTAILTLFAFLILLLFTRRTAAGLFIEATGDNEKASRFSGINTRAVQLLVYALCALLAGVAALVATADIQRIDASYIGLYIELDAILAVVIGGTPLVGGRFNLLGSLIGAILIQALTTTILTKGVPVEWTSVVKAVVIIAVCLLQSEAFRKTFFARLRRSTV